MVLLFPILLLFAVCFQCMESQWFAKEVAEWAIAEFAKLEIIRNNQTSVPQKSDRRAATPFISGDGFREHCSPHICEDVNRCRFSPEAVKDGQCVFVKSDMFQHFAMNIVSRIPGKYVIVSHNGDLSAPDGQDDAPRIGMGKYITTDILQQEYEKGRLLALHAQNLWWKNYTDTKHPAYAHCLPIGLENRQYSVGSNLQFYADMLKKTVVDRPRRSTTEKDGLPLLLVAFYPKRRVPDRQKVLEIIHALPKETVGNRTDVPFYHEVDLDHPGWLEAISSHKFVLAPFGHGLDTHRVSEILLMGGIPVMKRSTISSCYDDSDNTFRTSNRGSLPIVILESWSNLTRSRLELEWERLKIIPDSTWDYKRLFITQWLERIGKQ